MRVAFFGLPLAGELLARDGHELVLAALCRPGWPGERRLRARLGARVLARREVDLEAPAFHARVRDARPDLVVSWFWTTRLPRAVLEVAPLGGFGVHPSLLPRWRGPDPYFWAIDAGDRETGVTAHRLAEAYDTGAVLGRAAIALDPAWDAWTLARKLDRPSLRLLLQVAGAFAAGRPPSEEAQDEAAVTLAPAPEEDALELDFRWDAARIVRRVRAASPEPGAFTFLGDEQLTVTRAEVAADVPRALEAGEAAVVGGRCVVRAADAGVALLAGRDGDERTLDAAGIAALLARR